ncbi:MAG: serine/threonine-protein kinase [Gemmatimonadetes bacterium]|nr:serine/threonine-protein kinase [Gemmatimonadota bacterium]
MTILLERLRDGLAPDFRVERELARGGMGAVFLAHDTGLRRQVAIKVLLPEIATEATVARFLREARVLAALSHSHIVPVHGVGEADGLNYYVMDYLEGDTLEDRLRAGPLSVKEAVKLARDLLDALEAVHKAGVVHRDIKPANIFLIDRRTVLGDFGIARAPSDQTDPLTGTGGVIGTPAYMPPEQRAGIDVTARTDIYAVGMVIYEALTGRRWVAGQEPRDANWTGVPRSLIAILSRALAYSPHDRWPDARTFRKRIWATRVVQYRWRAVALTAGGLAAGILLTKAVPSLLEPPSPMGKLTLRVQPFEVRGNSPRGGIGDLVAARVEAVLGKDSEFHVLPAGSDPDSQPAVVLGGTVFFLGGSVTVSVRSLGETSLVVNVEHTAADWKTAADLVAGLTWRELWSENSPFAEWLPRDALPLDPEVFDRWWKAERLFVDGQFSAALRAFDALVRIDATCLLCSWRITEMQRWGLQPPNPIHKKLLLEGLERFPPWYRRLIEARLGPDIGRLAALEEAVKRWDDYYYAWYLLAEEQLGRGPLFGLERAAAEVSLERAARLRPDFAPVWWDRAQLAIAEGEEVMALDALQSIPEPGDLFSNFISTHLWQAYAYRFHDGRGVKEQLEVLFSDPTILTNPLIRVGPRRMPLFGTPEGAVKLGELYADQSVAAVRRSGLIAQVFGFFALGQMDSARDRADRLQEEFSSNGFAAFMARLEAVNWIFDPSGDTAPLESVIRDLERFASPSSAQPSSAGVRWILQIMEQQAEAPNRRWPYSDVKTGVPAFETIVEAARLARADRVRDAIALGNTLRGMEIAALVPDPFFRTVLHLLMARWYEDIGDRQSAIEKLRWHEAVDEANSPIDEPLVQEVDWAFGTLARWNRAQLLDWYSDTGREICRSFDAVEKRWQSGSSPYKARADTAGQKMQTLGCSS